MKGLDLERWKEHFLFRDHIRIEGWDRQNLREKMKSKIPFHKRERGEILIEGGCDCKPHFRECGTHPRWIK